MNATIDESKIFHIKQLMEERSREPLLKAIDNIFSTFSIGFINEHLTLLALYAFNPDCSKGLEKKDIISLAVIQSSVICYLSAIYAAYEDYKSSREFLEEVMENTNN